MQFRHVSSASTALVYIAALLFIHPSVLPTEAIWAPTFSPHNFTFEVGASVALNNSTSLALHTQSVTGAPRRAMLASPTGATGATGNTGNTGNTVRLLRPSATLHARGGFDKRRCVVQATDGGTRRATPARPETPATPATRCACCGSAEHIARMGRL